MTKTYAYTYRGDSTEKSYGNVSWILHSDAGCKKAYHAVRYCRQKVEKKYGENDVVINAIESHHGEVPANNVISNLVAAADALSAGRPGARSESLENYVKRIEQLENICKDFDGVSNAYAIQAGREVRVMVVPEKVDDIKSFKIARDIREKIEKELTYPGQIKVTVVRELRASEIAK